MMKRLLTVVSGLSLFTPILLYANDASQYPICAGLETGWSATHFAGFKHNGLYAIRVAGGYNFTQNIAAELAYTSYHSAMAETVYIKQASYDVLGVFSLPLIDHFSIYGKAGTAHMNATFKPTVGGDMNGSSWRFAYGLGFHYDISAHLLATIGWYHVNGKKAAFKDSRDLPAADFYSVGLKYRF